MSRTGTLIDAKVGYGKSLIALGAITESKAVATLILSPVSVRAVWRREVAKHTAGIDVVLPEKGNVARRAAMIEEHIARARITRKPFVVVVNYESAWRSDMAKVLSSINWHCLIADECFPAGTLIDTPAGPRSIETLAVGDCVLGRDDITGGIVETTVQHCFENSFQGQFVEVAGIRMTPNHPVWTAERGYVNAMSVSDFETVAVNGSNDKILHRLRNRVSPTWWAANVLPQMRPSMEGDRKEVLIPAYLLQEMQEDVQTETYCSGILLKELQEQSRYEPAKEQREIEAINVIAEVHAGNTREIANSLAWTHQPISQQSREGESIGNEQSQWVCRPDGLQGWERQRADYAASLIGRDTWMADGSMCAYKTTKEERTSDSLQTGYSEPSPENWYRDRWQCAQFPKSTGEGQEERWLPAKPWMEDRSSEERGSYERSSAMRGSNIPVFNIETGTGNYFAGGLLVHNCHRIKSPSGKASRFVARLRANKRIGLTGTPTPHSPLDIYGQARALAPGIFQRTFTAFRGNYAIITTAPGFPKIIGWQNTDDYKHRLAQFVHDCGNVDMNLPPVTDQIIDVQLEPKAARTYSEIEREFYAEVDRGEVTATNALTKILRLQQITGGTIRLDDGTDHEISESKKATLADILADLGGQRVAVFCRFKSDLAAVKEAVEKAGLVYGEISGETKDGLDHHALMQSHLDVVGVQIQSGGVGIDLTRASVGIFYSLTYSLGDYEQCKGRLHRPGQSRHTHFIHLVASGTVDTKIMAALEDKRDVIDAVVYGRQPRLREVS